MKFRLEGDQRKYDYVKANIELFEKAYLEFADRKNNRNRHKRYPTSFSTFVEQVRKDFNYSTKTVSIDIWNKFLFNEIIMGIHERYRKEQNKTLSARRALGYIVKPQPVV